MFEFDVETEETLNGDKTPGFCPHITKVGGQSQSEQSEDLFVSRGEFQSLKTKRAIKALFGAKRAFPPER